MTDDNPGAGPAAGERGASARRAAEALDTRAGSHLLRLAYLLGREAAKGWCEGLAAGAGTAPPDPGDREPMDAGPALEAWEGWRKACDETGEQGGETKPGRTSRAALPDAGAGERRRAAGARAGSPFLGTDEAAAYVGLARRTLEKMRVMGGGPKYRKHGRYVRYHIDELDAWSKAGARGSTAEG